MENMSSYNIPIYQLYGEHKLWPSPELIHLETIAERSALYNWEIKSHTHNGLMQLLYLKSGDGWMQLETSTQQLKPPCIIVIPAGCVHGFRFSPNIEGQIISIPYHSACRMMHDSGQSLSCLEQAHQINLVSMEHTHGVLPGSLFQQIKCEYQEQQPGRLNMIDALLMQLFIWLSRSTSTTKGSTVNNRQQDRMTRFRRLIEEHYREWLPTSFYARTLGVSNAQLNSLCRRESGQSAKALIHERLMLEARRLLVYSDQDITGIAFALGFEDPAYFSRFFTRHQAIPPSQFRGQHQI